MTTNRADLKKSTRVKCDKCGKPLFTASMLARELAYIAAMCNNCHKNDLNLWNTSGHPEASF